VGPVYLKGCRHRHYLWVGKDAFDGAVCLRLAGSRRMDEVLWFLRGLRLQKLPMRFEVPTGKLPLAAGRVTFLRRVGVTGTVTVLSQAFRVGKRHRGLYLRLVVDTKRGWLTAYLNGRVLKRWPYKLLND
jgi:hypothetical protein